MSEGAIPVPRLVAWEVTRRCNLKCRHCRASAGDCAVEGEFSLDEAKAVVDDIASFANPVLILTGGEPLMCEWVWDIIAYARERGMTPAVGTNGTLVDDEVARRLAASGVKRISVSLDFPTAGAHDEFRGVEGAFDAAVSGIAAARRAGVEVQVNTTVTRRNWRMLDEMHDLAVRLDAQALHPFLLVPTGRGAGLSGEELGAAEYEEALGWVCRRQRTSPLELKPTDAPQYRRIAIQQGVSCASRGRGCLAGTGFAFISHVGGVQPCGYFDMTLGNVRETPFSRIWRESPVFADLRRPERLKGKCGVCEYKAVCGGCRARALAVSGDYLAEEPNCAHVPDGILLDALQTDFPICERPYAALGERFGLSEGECYRRVCALREKGVIRRIGAAFNSRALGFVSTLVAFAVAEEAVDDAAAVVSASPFVTHNYRREGEFNLWFTLVAPSREKIDEIVEELRAGTAAKKAMELSSRRAYKLRAVFSRNDGNTTTSVRQQEGGSQLTGNADRGLASFASCIGLRQQEGGSQLAANGDLATPQPDSGSGYEIDSRLVRLVQGDISGLGPAPFTPEDAARLRELASKRVIRRFGAFLDHNAAGFVANALTVWDVEDGEVDALGEAFAGRPFASHCVRRTAAPGWPYSLYAMIHARSREGLAASIGELDALAESVAGHPVPRVVLQTVREYKKAPPRYIHD
ncbi:MAG: radical SAM protein [Kiritimatiellae bacterium]|nr:radical SAM protein [Kiritimatiellia bacterium]